MANLNRYFMQHLVTEVIPGPSAIRMDLLLNIPNMGLNGGNIQIRQTETSGKVQVMMRMMVMIKMMVHAV